MRGIRRPLLSRKHRARLPTPISRNIITLEHAAGQAIYAVIRHELWDLPLLGQGQRSLLEISDSHSVGSPSRRPPKPYALGRGKAPAARGSQVGQSAFAPRGTITLGHEVGNFTHSASRTHKFRDLLSSGKAGAPLRGTSSLPALALGLRAGPRMSVSVRPHAPENRLIPGHDQETQAWPLRGLPR